jgi:hypothetical protein
MLEQGLYDDALAAYTELLRADPTDEEALEGQKSSREKWIDRRLIDVRLHRQAGNSSEALARLLDAVNRERQWAMAPGGKVAFTQGEERDYAIIFAEHEVAKALAAKRPLQAHVFLTRNAPVIDSEPDARIARLKSLTRQSGQESCKPWRSGKQLSDKLNLDRLLRRYCQLWEAPLWPAPHPELQKSAPYYKALEIKTTVEGLPNDVKVSLEDQLSKALLASAWYEPGSSRVLPISVTGQYQEERRALKVLRKKVYSEDQPYNERVEVKRQRTVPYTEAEADGKVVTKYREESYQDYETLTKHRTVFKEYEYEATRRDQLLVAEYRGRFDLGGASEIAVQLKSESTGEEHSEDHPAIGLRPQKANLPDPAAWLRGTTAGFVTAFTEKIAAKWSEFYCPADAAGTDLIGAGEATARCLRQNHLRAPDSAQQWFMTNFGTSVEDALAVLRYP